MALPLPVGYRRLGRDEDVHELKAYGKIKQLCTCRHILDDHTGRDNVAPCLKCGCRHFIFARWVIKDD